MMKGADDEGYFKLTSVYSQELLLTATSAKLLEIKGKTLSTLLSTEKKCLERINCFIPTSTSIWLQIKNFAFRNDLFRAIIITILK